MTVNDEKWDPKDYLNNLKKRSEKKTIEMEQEKERLKQRILSEWHQHKSLFFWEKCFRFLDIRIIRQTFKNVNELEESGYPVKNKAGLFVSTLKKMGYFPWKEEKNVAN
ncbi:hypothetical protein ES703_45397 [subsurface metagenome]